MSEALQRAALNIIPDAVITMDEDGLIRSFNPIAQRIFGYSAEEIIGQPLRVLMPERFREPHEKGFRRYLETGEEHLIGQGPVELAGLRKSSEEFPLELSLGEMHEGGERLFVGIIRDVSERKRVEQALRQSEARFRTIFQESAVGISIADLDRKLLETNPAYRKMLGYTEEELFGKPIAEVSHPEDVPTDNELNERLLAGDLDSYQREKRYVRKDEGIVWIHLTVSVVRDGGQPQFLVGIVENINRRKRAERALKESKERFRKLIQNSSDVVTVYEADGTIRYVSPAIERMLGYKPEERIGANGFETLHPDDLPQVKRAFAEALQRPGATISIEVRARHRNGSWRYIEAVGTNLLSDPDLRAVVLNSRDVTERKQIEEELRRSEGRNRAIVEAYPDLMFRVNRSGEYLDFQANADDKLYIQREEIIGNNILDTLPSDVAAGALRHLARAFETGRIQLYEYRLPAPEGLRDFEARFVVTDDDEALCIIRDVTERKRVQDALQESEERFRQLFEQSVDTLIVHDEEGRIVDCNSEACRTLGYTREELLSLLIKDIANGLLSEEEKKEREEQGGTTWQRMVRGEPVPSTVVHFGEHKRKDGTTFPIEVHVGSVYYNGTRMVLASARDITERKEAERRLEESEQRYRSLFDRNPDAVYSFDLEGNFLTANASCEKVTGYAVEELLQMSFIPLIVPEDLERTWQGFERAASGEPQNYEIAITHKDGHRVELNVTKLPILVGGEIVGVYGIAKDITEHKRADEAVRESEERFRALVQNASEIVMVVGADGRVRYISSAVERVLGYEPDYVVGRDAFDIVHPDDAVRVQASVAAAAGEPGAAFSMELRLRHADGSWRHVESMAANLLENPAVGGVVINSRDVTERKLAEVELRESEERFHSAFDNTPVGMALVDLEGRYLQVNQALCELLGYSEEEFLNTTFQEITYPEDYEKSMAWAHRMWERETESYSLEKRYIHAEGHPVWVFLSVSLVRDQEDSALYHIAQVQDITGRKQAEEALRESEERYRSLVELSPDAVAVHSEGEIIYANLAAAELLGASGPEELIGRKALDFVHSDYRETVKARIKRALEEGESAPLLEEKYIRLDGSILDVEVAGAPIHYRGKPAVQAVFRDITERKKAEEDLRQSEERYRAVVERTAEGVYIHDFQTKRILETNTALQGMLEYSSEELLGRSIYDLIAHSRESIARNGQRIAEEKSLFLGERRYRRKDGSLMDVESSATVIPYAGKEAVCTIVRDITERKRAEEKLRKSEARNSAMLEANPDLIFVYSRDGEYLDIQANDPAKLYLPREELLGSNLRDVLPPEVADPFVRKITRTLDTYEMQVYEYQLNVPEGVLNFEARTVASGPNEVLCAVRDITERKSLEKQLRYQALHDPLTDLPNRTLFTDRLDHALARASRQGNKIAVLFTDLDNFKYVNDSLGHEMGDRLLVLLARRLMKTLRPGDTIARLGGDEFTILLEDIVDARDAKRAAERIEEALQFPLTLDGRDIFVSASIGISLSSSPEDQAQDLLRQADMAMYQVKNRGKAGHALFAPRMQLPVVEHLQLGSDLGKALKQDEFKLCYQPKVRLDTSVQQERNSSGRPAIPGASEVVKECRIVGMEALVRWEHPERGLLSPKEFIHVAEETGLILPLGRRVLEEACRQAGALQEQYPNDPPLEMCVNLSARQFQDPELIQDIARVLQETGLDPRRLQLEITESVIMEDAPSTITTLEKLTDLGVQLSIDDFGTGYSSLSYLKRFPVSLLKIDRAFVDGLEKAPEDSAIVSGIINLAHTLNMKVVAEGVETAGQVTHLQGIGCDLAQGNYFSEPLSGEKLEGLLARHRSTHS